MNDSFNPTADSRQTHRAHRPACVLHVLDDRADEACGTTLALLAQRLEDAAALGIKARVLLLGGRALGDAAHATGITDFERIAPPLGKPWLAPTVLHRAFDDDTGDEYIDGVEAWSLMALGAAAIFRPHTPRTVHILQHPDPAAKRRLSRLMMRAGFDAKTPTAHLRRELIDAGLPPGRVFHEPAVLRHIKPQTPVTVPPALHQPDAIRSRTIALLGDPAWDVPTPDVALALSMSLEITLRPLRLLVHPAAYQRARAQRLLDDSGWPTALLQHAGTDTPWDILGGVDAVMLGHQPAPLATPLALEAGIPILAPDLPHHREMLSRAIDDEQVFWAPDARPRHLAHALTEWVRRNDPTVRPPVATVGKLLAI